MGQLWMEAALWMVDSGKQQWQRRLSEGEGRLHVHREVWCVVDSCLTSLLTDYLQMYF